MGALLLSQPENEIGVEEEMGEAREARQTAERVGTSFLQEQEVTGPVCPHSPKNRRVSQSVSHTLEGQGCPRTTGAQASTGLGSQGRQLDAAMET